jgi:pyridoxal phosphate enzyme (YggS family)
VAVAPGPGGRRGRTHAEFRRNLAEVRAGIGSACRRSGRDPGGIRLIAVTKTVSVEGVRMARAAGIEDFGENYAKELAAKAEEVPATWHFIGRVQRGTAALIAAHAGVVHSAEPGEGLRRLASRAAASGWQMRALAQVDFTGRRQGVAPEELGAFLDDWDGVAGLDWIGLMTLPPQGSGPEDERPHFRRLRELRDLLVRTHPSLRELSMGMSSSYEVAVEEGATMVRVGTALFGGRPAR